MRVTGSAFLLCFWPRQSWQQLVLASGNPPPPPSPPPPTNGQCCQLTVSLSTHLSCTVRPHRATISLLAVPSLPRLAPRRTRISPLHSCLHLSMRVHCTVASLQSPRPTVAVTPLDWQQQPARADRAPSTRPPLASSPLCHRQPVHRPRGNCQLQLPIASLPFSSRLSISRWTSILTPWLPSLSIRFTWPSLSVSSVCKVEHNTANHQPLFLPTECAILSIDCIVSVVSQTLTVSNWRPRVLPAFFCAFQLSDTSICRVPFRQ